MDYNYGDWKEKGITRRADGSYVIERNGLPYHVPDAGEFSALWQEVDAYSKQHPGQVSDEPQPPTPTEDDLFAMLRAARDARLAETDYLLMPDYPVTEEMLEAVRAYRQALRDLPAQDGAPWDGGGELTPWPDKPEI